LVNITLIVSSYCVERRTDRHGVSLCCRFKHECRWSCYHQRCRSVV